MLGAARTPCTPTPAPQARTLPWIRRSTLPARFLCRLGYESLVCAQEERGGSTDRVRKDSTTVTTNMATERPARDQASQAAARRLIPPTLRSRSLAPAVTTPLYRKNVCRTLRHPLRGRRFGANFRKPPKSEVRRILLLRGWVNKGKRKGQSFYDPALPLLVVLPF